MKNFLNKIPLWLSSKPSIFIFIFLFCYLVIFSIITATVPAISHLQPSNDVQLLLGNYSNILSALGASLAAGGGVMIHSKVKDLHEKHDKLHNVIDELLKKIEKLSEKNV
jgi:hypothetical protein